MHDEKIRELTETRTMGSVPFGGRYRLIDFALSNMVNSGINKVGVITKSNYQSLMDHLGSGKAWDLSRKREGLFILPPFSNGNAENNSRIESLASIMRFLSHSNEEYVFLTDSDYVCNIDCKRFWPLTLRAARILQLHTNTDTFRKSTPHRLPMRLTLTVWCGML